MIKIKRIIESEVEKYKALFQSSEEGFLVNWPTKYKLFGWLVNMKSGGELAPHLHETGWISGPAYINVPPKAKTNAGNLVLSLSEKQDETEMRKNVEKIIDVATGNLILFPASLSHYTIPFESDEERIVLAFDVIPE